MLTRLRSPPETPRLCGPPMMVFRALPILSTSMISSTCSIKGGKLSHIRIRHSREGKDLPSQISPLHSSDKADEEALGI